MAEMRVPASITIDDDALTIDGVHIPLRVIPQMLYELVHPDPRKWYRWERVDDVIIFHVRISEDSNGTAITDHAGNAPDAERRVEDSGSQG